MSRERPTGRRRPSPGTGPERVRRRSQRDPEPELSGEELERLADEGVDPEDLRRAVEVETESQEASDHDRDTPRDQLEGLVDEQEDDAY